MSNLKSVKDSIKAELEHAKKGVVYYQSLVEALVEALSKLDSVGTAANLPVKKVGSARVARDAGKAKGRKPRQTENKKTGGLPSTAKDFWPSLLTEEPQSAPEILTAAIQRLGFTPDKKQIKKLQQRQTFALNSMVKASRIQDAGSGRERRFFVKK